MMLKKLINEKKIKNVISNEESEYHQINLEYYLVEQDNGLNQKVYGVEIIKKKILSNEVLMESQIYDDISSIKEYVEKTVKMFADNLVTPITLYDIIVDRLGCSN